MRTACRLLVFSWLCLGATTVLAGVYDDMIVAIRNDDTDKVIALLQRGMDVNTADANGTTLAMYAARSGNERLLEYLSTKRANLLIKNSNGDSATLFAALHGHLGCVKLLVKSGAIINPQKQDWAPLHYASFAGRLDIAAYLVEKGAQVDARAPNGMTALMLASRSGHAAVARLLLDHGADPRLKTPEGKTALDIAVVANETGIARMLGDMADKNR